MQISSLQLAVFSLVFHVALIGGAYLLMISSDIRLPFRATDTLVLLAQNLTLITITTFVYMLAKHHLFKRMYCQKALSCLYTNDHYNLAALTTLYKQQATSDIIAAFLLLLQVFILAGSLFLICLAACLIMVGLLYSSNKVINQLWIQEVDNPASGVLVKTEKIVEQIASPKVRHNTFKAWNLTLSLANNMAPWRFFLQYRLMPSCLSIAVIPGMAYYFIMRGIMSIADGSMSIGQLSAVLIMSLLSVSLVSSIFTNWREYRMIMTIES